MMRKTTIAVVLAVALVWLFTVPAGAVDVYLNGVQITGAKDQVIDKAKVTLDKNGNVAMSFNTAGMYRGYVLEDGEYHIAIYGDE